MVLASSSEAKMRLRGGCCTGGSVDELLDKLEVVRACVVVDALVVTLSCNRRQVGRCSFHSTPAK